VRPAGLNGPFAVHGERGERSFKMASRPQIEFRRESCARCGQVMFEYYRSPDGHFGVANRPCESGRGAEAEIACPTCGALYILLDRLDAQGRPVRRAGENQAGPRLLKKSVK